MTFVIAEPCTGVKDTACVDACPVDCIRPKKSTTYEDGPPSFDEVSQLYIDPIEPVLSFSRPIAVVRAQSEIM
jgi:NAD-dependent dihydropyrimidine dehydrogenase PreA subunit